MTNNEDDIDRPEPPFKGLKTTELENRPAYVRRKTGIGEQ